MDDTQFDTWTRRRFGLAVGGAAATALGLLGALGLGEDETEARQKHNKNKNRRNNRRRRRNRNRDQCRKLGQSCDETRRRQRCCNENQLCAQVADLGSGNFCCRQLTQSCSSNADCCGANRCRSNTCQLP